MSWKLSDKCQNSLDGKIVLRARGKKDPQSNKNTRYIMHMCWMNPIVLCLVLFEETVQSVDSPHQLIIDFSGLANWKSQNGSTQWSLPGTRSWLPVMTTGFIPEQVGYSEGVSHTHTHTHTHIISSKAVKMMSQSVQPSIVFHLSGDGSPRRFNCLSDTISSWMSFLNTCLSLLFKD